MNIYCNPLNLEYKYQVWKSNQFGNGKKVVYREAADPSLILFKDKYYMFPSMTDGFYVSTNLKDWEHRRFKGNMPIYDYAPDICVVGEYIYFSASKRDEACSFFRTKDPENESFEEIKGTFHFWDPALFRDDDGRLYFFWGCSNDEPIYGVELNEKDMTPMSEPLVMFDSNKEKIGYERIGNNHIPPMTEKEKEERINSIVDNFVKQKEQMGEKLSQKEIEEARRKATTIFDDRPYIEGAWLTKYKGKYYLQYAIPGTQYNVYGDGVYIADKPLGPYVLAKSNPYSYVPGGFAVGAGHGSTMKDKNNNYWHTSTISISKNYDMERRLGLWKAGFDHDGDLYCDQRYSDWPKDIDEAPFSKPKWMLLSFNKNVICSSGKNPEYICNESIRNWWRADSNKNEWIEIDLGKIMDVRAIQINFADQDIDEDKVAEVELINRGYEERGIDRTKKSTRWLMEGSIDGKEYFTIEDKRNVDTDLSHDFLVREDGLNVRYIRVSDMNMPYNQNPCISGLRIFGNEKGKKPEKIDNIKLEEHGELDISIKWEDINAVGYNVLWGYKPKKLYHSYIVYGNNHVNIGALIEGEPLYIRVDAFNECGITEGTIIKAK